MSHPIQLLTEAYAVLADVHNQWPGRHTAHGQSLLCRMCEAIAVSTGRSEEDVQNEAQEPDGEAFRGTEAADYLAEQQALIQRTLK